MRVWAGPGGGVSGGGETARRMAAGRENARVGVREGLRQTPLPADLAQRGSLRQRRGVRRDGSEEREENSPC